ncbi:MAG: BamA/TamA family outer membrane protein [Flavobacteriales bacterium]
MSRSRQFKIACLIAWGAMLLAGCARLRNVPDGQAFLRRQDVIVHTENPTKIPFDVSGLPVTPLINFEVPTDEILSYSRLKPNKRILWFRFNHSVYLLVNKKKLSESQLRVASRCQNKNNRRASNNKTPVECKSWRMFWAYTVGEQTALLDSAKMLKSAEQMNFFLQKKGYFRSKVEPEVVYNPDSSKCKVNFHVYPGKPYHIKKVDYQIQDVEMAKSLANLRKLSTIDSMDVFDVKALDIEREAIANFFNERGYYDFNKEYVVFDADTTAGGNGVNITLRIEQPQVPSQNKGDSLVSVPHKKYFIGNVYVHTRFDLSNPDYVPTDTLEYDGLKILCYGSPDLDADVISCAQSYRSGDMYQRSRIELTYRRFSQMGVFKSTTIQLIPRETSINEKIHILDTHIRLSPEEKQSYFFYPHLTNRSGNMGIYGNLSYTHRNLFGGAEALDFNIITGLEASQNLAFSNDETDNATDRLQNNFKLNTFEIGPEITYRVPRLWPLGCDFTAQSSEPQTSLSATYNYQRRPDYVRTLSQVRYAYNWIENPDAVSRISWDVVEFSIIKIQKSEAFQEFLDRLQDAFLENSYQDHLILATNATYTLNTQKAKYQSRYYYMRLGASAAGNALNGVMDLTDQPFDSLGSHRIYGIRFAQYFRGEGDFRFYSNVNDRNAFVFRAYGGLGVPRKNAITLPFEKSFFSGGANGLRAWQARTLGPGSSRDALLPQTFNNIGELKLEGNVEYRFKFTQMLNWAFFADAGNIWLLNEDTNRPGADFKADRFLSEIAIGGGFGLRIDFDYFLVRLDVGVQLKDPAKVQGERWLWQPKDEYLAYLASTGNSVDRIKLRNNTVFNLGIGFPF